MINPGIEGEQVVAQWLQQEGWIILHHRWRCRWGELDLIAQLDETLAFIEVKTRASGNWDQNGLLAISEQKQERLRNAAELFLSQSPELANYGCRFDVALVRYQPISHGPNQFTILEYLQGAF